MSQRGSACLRWLRAGAAAVALLAAGGLVGWALAAVLVPRPGPLVQDSFVLATVRPGSVEASTVLNVSARWTAHPAGRNAAAGVVTGVEIEPGAQVGHGEQLYRVDERPVVAAEGEVPAFRDIAEGSEGADVAQLQRMLIETGFHTGVADGKAGPSTTAAVRMWQRSLGVEPTGTVRRGDVVFLAELPARVTLDPEVIALGALLTGGEEGISVLSEPRMRLAVTEAQAAPLRAGMPVEITSPEGALWQAVTAERTTDADTGAVDIALMSPNDGPICGDDCAQIPVTGEVLLRSTVTTVEAVAGLVVPSAALVTDASGRLGLLDRKGALHPVEVIAAARGMSVVEGVPEGLRVRVPGSHGGEGTGPVTP